MDETGPEWSGSALVVLFAEPAGSDAKLDSPIETKWLPNVLP